MPQSPQRDIKTSPQSTRSMVALQELLAKSPLGSIAPVIGKWLIDDIRSICELARRTDGEFFSAVLESQHIRYECSEEDLQNIPPSGPAVIVANHPFGMLDGVILGALLGKARPDYRLLVNFLIAEIPEMAEHVIAVDPFGGAGATRSNRRSLRQSIEWLKAGGVLGVFPAGEVATIRMAEFGITDREWAENVARLALQTKVPVVPIFFHGTNSPVFHLAGLVHERLRTLLLSRELRNKAGSVIRVSIGRPIPPERLMEKSDARGATEYLRARTFILESRANLHSGVNRFPLPDLRPKPAAIAGAQNPGALASDISNLPAEQHLLTQGEYEAWIANASQIPFVLSEIGRLREVAFRQVGEGSNQAADLDRFDEHYEHLFIWNSQKREIVGAYRVAKSDGIAARYGVQGLYTSTLFHLQPEFYDKIHPALELGRSFVRPEYQKAYLPLLMLWKGIGHYVAKFPQYRLLFGPVSISKDYNPSSRALIVSFLKSRHCDQQLAEQVKPRKKFKIHAPGEFDARNFSTLVGDLNELSEVIGDLEPDHKGIPILLQQYLNLGGRVLDFSVDRKFSNVLDGLIIVDLARTSQRQLEFYMGKANAAAFLKQHAAVS